MPRTLPWLKKAESKPKRAREKTPPLFPPPQPKPAYRQFRDQNSDAFPSDPLSSPVATTAAPPPQFEEMIDGDDAWILVEDELYSTAQTFTKSLHNDELKRLQKEARERADVMSRPVTGSPASKYYKSKSDIKRAKIDQTVDSMNSNNPPSHPDELEEEQDLIISDRNLAGLMFNEEPAGELSRHNMASLGMSKPKTRAAAGLSRQREDYSTRIRSVLTAPPSSPPLPPPSVSLAAGDDEHGERRSDELDVRPAAQAKRSRQSSTPSNPPANRTATPKSPSPPMRLPARDVKPVAPHIKEEDNGNVGSGAVTDAVLKWRMKKKQKAAAGKTQEEPAIKQEEETRPVYSMDTIPMF